MDFIRISEMLSIMDSKGEDNRPIPFKFTFVTCNLKKETGGQRISCDNVIQVGGVNSNSTKRDPNHFKNFTRNFRSVDNEEVRSFHPLLVETFNDLKVIL